MYESSSISKITERNVSVFRLCQVLTMSQNSIHLSWRIIISMEMMTWKDSPSRWSSRAWGILAPDERFQSSYLWFLLILPPRPSRDLFFQANSLLFQSFSKRKFPLYLWLVYKSLSKFKDFNSLQSRLNHRLLWAHRHQTWGVQLLSRDFPTTTINNWLGWRVLADFWL